MARTEAQKRANRKWAAKNRGYLKAWHAKNPGKRALYDAKYDPDGSKSRAFVKQWVERNPDKAREISLRHKRSDTGKKSARARALLRKYNLTLADFDRLTRAQNGVCAVCREPPSAPDALVVDHCHATGIVRGLLCWSCNIVLGHMRDSASLLRCAADYLERSR